ncbi:hypothetical protein C7457_0121 [Thermovibrio guaymasensis]|uniref:Flagellar protein FliO/FliZ n=1 Tax=Thermovibrio guaymasensis TaxID=240167 RepID=A0A420W7G4_9BACT|nr:hypothetical protein C7457_0121 [Thermovibrio guaymasensis]
MYSELQFLLNSLTVIGALVFLYYLINRYGFKFPYNKGGRNLELLEKLPLSGDSGLIVFRAGKRQYLGFYSRGDFKILKEIKDDEDSSTTGFSANDGSRRNS